MCGARAGARIRSLRMLPLLTAGAFLLGAWVLFDPGEPAFLRYAGGYLAIGTAAMLLRAAIRKSRS
ncbi:MAG: hypothetical protein Q4D31_01080 [Eubacteriales bacterium]|nr:hypothetical protein [Eubacteriales bacterium]